MAVLTRITQRSLADNAVTSAKIAGDVIAATDIADDAIGTAELANDISISTSGNIATTGSGTLAVAGTSALTGNVTAAGTLGVTGATTLTGAATASGGLSVVGATSLTSIKQTDAQNLSGTYTTHELIMGKTFTLTGNLTVNENLILASMAGSNVDITIQPDSTARTITSSGGTGILEGGEVMGSGVPDLTGMTGELGNAVTGAPALHLSNAIFPKGMVIQTVSFTDNNTKERAGGNDSGTAFGSLSRGGFKKAITPHRSNSDILITIAMNVGASNNQCHLFTQIYDNTNSCVVAPMNTQGHFLTYMNYNNNVTYGHSRIDGTILYEQPTIASPPNSIEIEVKVAHHAGLTFYMNRRGTDATYGKGTSTIILQEIAG